MGRIRSVKPEYFTHPEIVALSVEARLLFVALWTQADDDGRLYDQPRKIAALSFGDDDTVDVERALSELSAAGKIRRYVVSADGLPRRCIEVVNFGRHQRIPPTKYRPSIIPAGQNLSDLQQPRSSTDAAIEQPGVSLSRAGVGTGNREPGDQEPDALAAPPPPAAQRPSTFADPVRRCVQAFVDEARAAGYEPAAFKARVGKVAKTALAEGAAEAHVKAALAECARRHSLAHFPNILADVQTGLEPGRRAAPIVGGDRGQDAREAWDRIRARAGGGA